MPIESSRKLHEIQFFSVVVFKMFGWWSIHALTWHLEAKRLLQHSAAFSIVARKICTFLWFFHDSKVASLRVLFKTSRRESSQIVDQIITVLDVLRNEQKIFPSSSLSRTRRLNVIELHTRLRCMKNPLFVEC